MVKPSLPINLPDAFLTHACADYPWPGDALLSRFVGETISGPPVRSLHSVLKSGRLQQMILFPAPPFGSLSARSRL
jgi:hypothetical protein